MRQLFFAIKSTAFRRLLRKLMRGTFLCLATKKYPKNRAFEPPTGVLSDESKWNSLRTFAVSFRSLCFLLLTSVAQKQNTIGILFAEERRLMAIWPGVVKIAENHT